MHESALLAVDARLLQLGAPIESVDRLAITLVESFCIMPPADRKEYLSYRWAVAPAIRDKMRRRLSQKPGDILSDDEIEFILRLQGILGSNALHFGHKLIVYKKTSCIRHSCTPNVGFHPMGNDIVLFALTDIPAGTELTISYVPVCLGRDLRRQECWKNYRFMCNCPACDLTNESFDSQGYEILINKFRVLAMELGIHISDGAVTIHQDALWTSGAFRVSNNQINGYIERLGRVKDLLKQIPNMHRAYLVA